MSVKKMAYFAIHAKVNLLFPIHPFLMMYYLNKLIILMNRIVQNLHKFLQSHKISYMFMDKFITINV